MHLTVFNKFRDTLRHYFGALVYGATDGIVTTFSIVSGVEGASLESIVVVILGIVNLLADGVSMGAASFLSIRSGAVAKNEVCGIKKPLKHAIATFSSFIVFGAIPLISFLVPSFNNNKFLMSCIMTGIALFVVGKLRSLVAKESLVKGAAEMLIIGGSAAFIAYMIGFVIAQYIH